MSKPFLFKGLVLGVFIGVLGLVASPFHFALNLEENLGLGLLFKLRGARTAPPEAVVVSIDRESSENLNVPDNPDKWPRSLHARLTDALTKAGARAIAFDVHFIEPKTPDGDRALASALKNSGKVVLTEHLKMKEITLASDGSAPEDASHNIVQMVPPIELFAKNAAATAPFTLPRIPFKVNQYWTFEKGAGDSPSVPVIMLQLYEKNVYVDFARLLEQANPKLAGKLPAEESAFKDGIKELVSYIRTLFENDSSLAGKMFTKLERSPFDKEKKRRLGSLIKMYGGAESRYINYYGPPGSIRTIPYYKLLMPEKNEERIDLRDKAVFVGLSEVLLAERKDSFYTVFSRANGTFIGGVEIAATAFSNLLTDTPVKKIGFGPFVFFILIWGVLMGVLSRIGRVWLAALCMAVLGCVYLYFALYQFRANYTWFPVIIPLFFQVPLAFVGGVVWNYVDTNKEKKNIRKAFEHYLPKDVVAQLAKDLASIQTGNKVVYGTCLFTDAQNYTSLSENMEPQELGRFMNRYYEMMFRPVKQNGGFVSGIIGDAMLALWVSATPEGNQNENACRAALEISRELQARSEDIILRTRIGLHYGQILLGHIGALDHYEYTPMGDIVNTASRIEGLNKFFETSVLVSERVVPHLKGFITRDLGKFRVKGKVKPIAVHELMSRIDESSEKERTACALFAEGMDTFRKEKWDAAKEKFLECVKVMGEDGPAKYYAGICEKYKASPPGEAWGGVINMAEK